ncbi:MAG: DUF962 domain-containing protein [Flavobacteriaceae bacterium]|nr:DUF962 domain-containing protein [Flavobacteriaceae bacterium]
MPKEIKTYEEFYLFYLKEHSNKMCRALHFIGTTIVLALVVTAIIHLDPNWLIFVPISGYGFAWVGHFFFEKNKPTSFAYPLWSFKSDFKMYFEILNGKISLDASQDNM